jgi:hypothetical protein
MVVLNLNIDSLIYLHFQLNIPRVKLNNPRVGSHLMRESLSPHMRSVNKIINSPFPISLRVSKNW